jgi:hypothetical protein
VRLRFWRNDDADEIKVLQRAKNSLTEETWAKGEDLNALASPPRMCIITAVSIESMKFTNPGLYGRTIQRIRQVLPEGQDIIIRFNDDSSTTLTDIHEVFDKAIALK